MDNGRTEINYWVPYMTITYTGDKKPLYMWLYHTFPSYIAAWKIWFSCFWKLSGEYGIIAVVFNLKSVSLMIPAILNHLIKLGRGDSR